MMMMMMMTRLPGGVAAAAHQISACLERARAELSRRSVELEDMMLEWRQFDETMAEFERWVAVVEDDCQLHAARAADACTVNDVTQLIADNHVSVLSSFSRSINQSSFISDKTCP